MAARARGGGRGRAAGVRGPGACGAAGSTLRFAKYQVRGPFLTPPPLPAVPAVTSLFRLSQEARKGSKGFSGGLTAVGSSQGLGNDFIMVDNRASRDLCMSPEEAQRLCDRNFGVGADGVIFATQAQDPSNEYDFDMYNSDGSSAEMCGNGIRCLARYVAELDGRGPGVSRVGSQAGLMVLEVRPDRQVTVDMGTPVLEPADVPTTIPPTHGAVIKAPFEAAGESWLVSCVSMGNPHCLVYARGDGSPLDVSELDLPAIGPAFEAHPAFPAKTNTEFVQVLDRGRVRMRVWERGAAETLACGTGACATVVAGVLEGHINRECVVELPGGPLEILWRPDNDHVMMTGPGEKVYSGELTL